MSSTTIMNIVGLCFLNTMCTRLFLYDLPHTVEALLKEFW